MPVQAEWVALYLSDFLILQLLAYRQSSRRRQTLRNTIMKTKTILELLLGFNAISLIHLMHLNPRLYVAACKSAFSASRRATTKEAFPIPGIGLGEILADRKPKIQLSVTQYEDGMLPSDQAMALLSILVAEAPREVLEIGTFMGHTTRQMAENLTTATVHTVDLPENFSPENDPETNLPKDDFHLIASRTVGREFKGNSCENRIKQHFADTAKWDFREAGQPTFFFIDGAHTYEYCKSDSEKCFELCQGRGVFLWHDCDEGHPGVIRFISEWRELGRDIRRISGTAIAYWKSV